MAGTKRDRHRQGRQARLAALAAARRRKKRQRMAVLGLLGVAAVAGIVFLVSTIAGDDGTEVTSGTSTTVSSVPAADSAAGKPCVAVADPLPAGATAVPVEVGPPPTQLITRDIRPGTGAEVTRGATVTVHYTGVACTTGKIFDSSYRSGQPATFSLSQVIKGWGDGLPGMKVGGQRLLGIPAAQAYGPTGSPPHILPDEPLWFLVEVLDTKAA